MENITIFGETNFRNQKTKFGIKLDDRRRHMYIIGKTGVGKTELLKNMIISDMKAGCGLAFIDPHGDTARDLLDFVPEKREKDVIYFNPSDTKYPISFNPLEAISEEHRHLVAGGILEIFKKIWPDVWSARMEYILNNALMALLEYPDSTLLEIMRLLTDNVFREKVVESLTDPVIKGFWTGEFARYHDKFQTEAIAPIQNKVGQFLTNPIIRNIIGQKKSSFDVRRIMDEKKIFIVNISKGLIGETNAALLGALLVSKIQQAAMSRADIPESKREDFFLYVDEFQTFATESFADILSEARKYRLSLIVSHQYIAQLPEKVRDAIFGNIGTFVSFRVGAEDAEWLEKEMEPEFIANDLVNLPKYNVYTKLMIDGISSRAFSAATLPPKPAGEKSGIAEKIIENIRLNYSRSREDVQKVITDEWAEKEEAETREREAKSKKKTMEKAKFKDYCWACGEEVGLSFEPDKKRAIYCRSCLEKVQEGKIAPVSRPQKMETLILKTIGLKKDRPKKERPEPPRKSGVNLNDLRASLRSSLGKLEQKPEPKKGDENNSEEIKEKKDEEEIKPMKIMG